MAPELLLERRAIEVTAGGDAGIVHQQRDRAQVRDAPRQ
jgi:hypothetical protein